MHTALCVFGGAEFFQDLYMDLFSLKSYEAYFEIFIFLFQMIVEIVILPTMSYVLYWKCLMT